MCNLAHYGDALGTEFLDEDIHMWIAEKATGKQTFLDFLLALLRCAASHADIADQWHRDVPAAAYAKGIAEVGRTINLDFH